MTGLRSALRALKATPLVSLIAILSLALGIGANTAMFSIVDALILRSLPVPHAERLALLGEVDGRMTFTNPIWEEVRERATPFDGAFAVGRARFNAATRGVTDPVDGLFVSAHYFDVLGVPAVQGRTFTEADDRRGGGEDGPVAVISHAFWQTRFAGRADVVGQPLSLNGVSYTVIGVAPSSFFGHEVGRTFDVVVPLGTEPLIRGDDSRLDARSTWWINIFLRLQPDQSFAQATTLLRAVQSQVRDATIPPDWEPSDLEHFLMRPFEARAAASGTSSLRGRYTQPLYALMAVVAFTLLIACGNIANLMLARATARRPEFAMRTALGASQWRLARQLMGENLLLSGLGAGIGVLVALWGSRLILSEIGSATNRVFLDVGLDWRMLGFTAVIAIGTTLLFGVGPAMLATRVAPMEAIKQQRAVRGGAGKRIGVAGSLVMAQVALSLMLLVSAGLFVQTFTSLAKVELGFTPEQVMVVTLNSQAAGVPDAQRSQLYERMQQAARAVPGVSAAGVSVVVPVSGGRWSYEVAIPGKPDLPIGQRIVDVNLLSPGWFSALSTQIIAGRDFDSRDHVGSTRKALVNRAFAERFFDGENPVGQTIINPGFGTEPSEPVEIIGFVSDAVYVDLRTGSLPTMYWALAQDEEPPSTAVLSVRATTTNLAALTEQLTTAFARVNPDVTLAFRPLESYVDASLAQERLIAKMAGFFGVLALLLAALGLYGITAYAVSRRQVELGIRMALGASPVSVVRLVMTRTGALVAGGIMLGGIASWWTSRYVSSLLFGLAPTDPTTIAGAMVVLGLVALVAGWIPARRAARVDPALVMREG